MKAYSFSDRRAHPSVELKRSAPCPFFSAPGGALVDVFRVKREITDTWHIFPQRSDEVASDRVATFLVAIATAGASLVLGTPRRSDLGVAYDECSPTYPCSTCVKVGQMMSTVLNVATNHTFDSRPEGL